jgi:hypothetical protein
MGSCSHSGVREARALASASMARGMPSSREEVTSMRRSILTALVALALVSPAQADVWEFSWTSDVSGIRFASVTSGVSDVSTSTHSSGSSLASVTGTAGGGVAIDFATPAGMAALSVGGSNQVGGTAPGLIPDAPGGTVASSLPATPGWFLANVGATGTYTWTGNADHPDTFKVASVGPGSGPAVEVAFAGMGRLVQGSTSGVAQATEPDLALLCVGLLGAALLARRRRA